MNKLPRWVTTALLVGTIIIVVVLIFVAVAAKYRVPVTSLLPDSLGGRPLVIPSPSTTSGGLAKTTGVIKTSLNNGNTMFIVNGKFVSKPTFDGDNLQSEFMVDEDPLSQKIPVNMIRFNGMVNLGKNTANNQKVVWNLVSIDEFRNEIKVNTKTQLQIEFFPGILDSSQTQFQNILTGMSVGKWQIPLGFEFRPTGVVVFENN